MRKLFKVVVFLCSSVFGMNASADTQVARLDMGVNDTSAYYGALYCWGGAAWGPCTSKVGLCAYVSGSWVLRDWDTSPPDGSTEYMIVDGNDYGTYIRTPATYQVCSYAGVDYRVYNFNDEGWSGYVKIFGQGGDDHLYGTDNNDVIYGGADDDYIDGNDGDDYLAGEYGNDELFGDYGNDEMYGGYGNDIMSGWYGVDTLFGGDGNDSVCGDHVDAYYYHCMPSHQAGDYSDGGLGYDHCRADDMLNCEHYCI